MSSNLSKKIKYLFDNYGNSDYIGEEVTQKEHAIQAAMLAEEEYHNDKITIAALLHDIGHLIGIEKNLDTMDEYGIMEHENIGYNFAINNGLGLTIAKLIKGHVYTKRYLVSKYKEYYLDLSSASKNTFEYQGGKLNTQEIQEYEKDELFKYHIKMREWDDKAKQTDIKLKSLDHYLLKIDKLLTEECKLNNIN